MGRARRPVADREYTHKIDLAKRSGGWHSTIQSDHFKCILSFVLFSFFGFVADAGCGHEHANANMNDVVFV